MQIALAFKLIEKPKRNPEVEKKVASAPVGDVRSRHLTTFSTSWGLKRYTQLNFGTVIAQEGFHEEVKKTISGVQGDKNITADIIVYGKTPVTRPSTQRHSAEIKVEWLDPQWCQKFV